MLIDFLFDFETRSRAELKKVGAVKYGMDPSTEATLITWCFGEHGEVKAWRLGEPIPADLIEVAKNPHKFNFIAHNILFDYMIWVVSFARLIPGLVVPPIKNLTDNMALTNYNRMTSGLDSAAAMLELPYSKDKEGGRLMRLQCRPDKDGNFPVLTPEQWHQFEYYGLVDTKILREVYYRMVPLPISERYGFEWTFMRNIRGVRIDMDLLRTLEEILAKEIPILRKEFYQLTGRMFVVSQRARCLEYFQRFYPNMEDMKSETVRETLDGNNHPFTDVKRALEIYSLASSTSLAKIPTARIANHGGRMYAIWNFLKAGTRRWAGMGIQPQNFPRSEEIELLKDLNLVDLNSAVRKIAPLQEDLCKFVKDLLRRLWLPDIGKHFYCGDFSKIEPTVMFWLLGMGRLSKMMYEEMAAEIYGVKVSQIGKESEERQIGKNSELGCIAEGELVFTDSGYKEIQYIELSDKIWDGQEWVKHEGILAKGQKAVMRIEKLSTDATPDHLFLSSEGWRTSVEMDHEEDISPLMSDGYLVTGPSSAQSLRKASNVMSRCAVLVRLKAQLGLINSGLGKLSRADHAQILLEQGVIQKLMRLLIYSPAQSSEKDGTIATTMPNGDAPIPIQRIGKGMEVGEFTSTSNHFESFWNTLLRSVGLTNGCSQLTGLIMMDTMSVETYESLASQKIVRIVETYDILNCGPRNMFMVNGYLAHNCGYGLGWKGFTTQVKQQAGIVVSEELAKKAVAAYRRKRWQVTEFWGLLEAGFITAIQGRTASLCNGKVHIMPLDKPLKGVKIRLPSGSYLFYPGARVEGRKLSYKTYDKGRVIQENTYGGKLCENVVSATARDIMLSSMYRLEDVGFENLGTVHDEVWSQNEPGLDELYEKTMCTIPSWCGDMHVTVESKNGERYLK